MANYSTLSAAIAAAIKTNGTQAITGQSLQTILLNMVEKLGAGYQFGGVVSADDAFPSEGGIKKTDVNWAFLACTPGKYTDFGNFTLLSGEVAVFLWNGTWKKQIVSYYANTQVYGVRHYYTAASPDLTRIGAADLHRDLPVQSLMRRCVVDDLGVVKYYLKADDSTKKEDGTAANLTGADGMVMVEIPAHYRKCTTDAANAYMDVEISLYPFEGAVAVPRYLVSAYEATIDRSGDTLKLASVVNTTAAFRGGNNNADWDGTYRSLLGLPATNVSLTNFRTYGRNRGTGWGCYDYNAHLAIYWLFAIEYATLNSQKAFNGSLTQEGYRQGGLGAGVSDMPNWSNYNSAYPFVPCGTTNSLGNATGVADYVFSEAQAEALGQAYTAHVNSYRGIELPFGHIWKWTDGFLGKGVNGEYQDIYVCRNPEYYASTLNEHYIHFTDHEAAANGYCKAIVATDVNNLATEIRVYGDIFDRDDSGTATTYFCDQHWHGNTADTIYGLLVGGTAYHGSNDGLACFNAGNAPAYASANIGSRLCWSE